MIQRNFPGSALVDWLLKFYPEYLANRGDARLVCDYLLQEKRYISHNKYSFRDGLLINYLLFLFFFMNIIFIFYFR